MSPKTIWYLFNRPRAERQRQTIAGRFSEEGLYGFYRLRDLGYDTQFSDEGHKPSLMRWGLKRVEDVLSNKGQKVGFNLAQAWTLRRKLDKADVIFATADSSGLGALALKSLGLIRRPVVYASIGLVAGFENADSPVQNFYRRLLKHADRVIYYGHEEGPMLQKQFDILKDRLCFIPFCIETKFFEQEFTRDGNPLAVGLDHRRDWPLLFQAASKCNFSIDLVCNPDTLQGLTVPENVNLIKPLPMVDLREKMARARFVILPVKQNAYTGATITLLQAMAAGCATIVSQTKAIETGYDFKNRENCLLVSPGDCDQLIDGINLLHNDNGLCRQLGANGKKTVRDKNDIAQYAKALDGIFKEVIKPGGGNV